MFSVLVFSVQFSVFSLQRSVFSVQSQAFSVEGVVFRVWSSGFSIRVKYTVQGLECTDQG